MRDAIERRIARLEAGQPGAGLSVVVLPIGLAIADREAFIADSAAQFDGRPFIVIPSKVGANA